MQTVIYVNKKNYEIARICMQKAEEQALALGKEDGKKKFVYSEVKYYNSMIEE